MLDTSKIEDPNAIEEVVCKAMDKLTQNGMNTELCKLLITLSCGEIKDIPDSELPFISQLIKKRIENGHDYTIDMKLLLFLSEISQTPGKAVMYIWYLQYKSKELGIKAWDMDNFIFKIFTNGFFSDEDLNEVWEAQKVSGGSNLVDHYSAGLSINDGK